MSISGRWFSRQADVHYTTIYRLTSNEQQSLSFLNAQKILKHLDPEQLETLLSKYYPEESRGIFKIGEQLASQRLANAEAFADDRDLYRIFLFATAGIGVNRTTILQKWGEYGLQKLENLIQSGAVREEDGQFVDKLEGGVYPSDQTAKRIVEFHLEMISLQSPASHLHNIRGAVTYDGLVAIYEEEKRHKARIEEIAASMKGEIPFLASSIAGSCSMTE